MTIKLRKQVIEILKVLKKKKTEQLTMNGWKVLRFWEHELHNINLVLDKIFSELSSKKE